MYQIQLVEFFLLFQEADILPTVHELGISFIAYSPLSRGFLSGELRKYEDLDETDGRRRLPRFQPENFSKNIELVDQVREMAIEKNCTSSQLALAWTMAKGALPIPGTKRISYLEENITALDVELSLEDLESIETVMPRGSAFGNRL
ncbi:aldo/keto reductase [Priestia megaterium]|uniref:aldo/keto reductase n=1 Tax=Priestia megaterium TaxID=1404 RepID=UPI0020418241|nr:aldo/keto reductase [Priestia megaterium]MCM3186976.1 aldo/keto reductase [Priestia megaterium]